MGTPEFAVEPLKALMEQTDYNIAAVVTVPDKASGRGLQVHESAVKQFAVEHGIPVLQPEKLKDPDFLAQLKSYDPDMFIVVAFRMLPKEVWSMPRLGTFNLHASILPQYRGAAPINWAIINGERQTGVTIPDTGDAVRDGDRGQPGATGERRVSDALNAVWDGDRGQPGAIIERLVPDAGDAVADGDRSQPFATVERIVSDARDAVSDGD